MSRTSLQQLRVNDPVLTQLVHGYCQAESIAPFVAPVIPVSTRAGKIVKFGKEDFAVYNTKRAPSTIIQRVAPTYSDESYNICQHAIAGEVCLEEAEEAANGEARIDLRNQAVLRAAAAINQSWEKEVTSTITNAALYEANNLETLAGTDQFSDPNSDPEMIVQNWKEAIRSQIGCYPNSAVIDTATYNALKFHPIFRDRIKYTSAASVNLDMLATWFDLPRGIMVSQRVFCDQDGNLSDFMPKGSMVVFYSPEGPSARDANNAVFMPQEGANRSTPAAFYSYQLSGYPIVEPERMDPDRLVYLNNVVLEQSIVAVGLGPNNLIGAAFYGSGTVS